MLTNLDESFLHQMPATFSMAATSDHRFYDRCFVSMIHPQGDMVVSMGMGLYKNMNVIDGFALAHHNRIQHNVRVSRQLRPDVSKHSAGPLHYEVLEPYKTLRIRLEPGDYPFSFDVIWRGYLQPFLETETVNYVNGRLATHVQRYDQTGSVEGWVEWEGDKISFNDWHGVRDHSWGVRRDVGGFDPINGPHTNIEKGFLIIWCVFQAGDCAGYLQVHQDGDGNITKMDGLLRWHPDNGRAESAIVSFSDDVEFVPGTRSYQRARFNLVTEDGSEFVLEAQPIAAPTVVHGGGYERGFNDGQGVGVWRGTNYLEWDSYDISDDANILKIQDNTRITSMQREQVVQVIVNGKEGFGDLTILPYGKIPRYHLGELDDEQKSVVRNNQI